MVYVVGVLALFFGIIFIGVGIGIYNVGCGMIGLFLMFFSIIGMALYSSATEESKKRAIKSIKKQKDYEKEYGIIDYKDKEK